MQSISKERFVLKDFYPNTSVTSVLLFSENDVSQQPIERYTIRGIIRMQGYGDLSLDEKLITYREKLAVVIDEVRRELNAPLFGFINIPEATQMLDGSLDNAVSKALQTTRKDVTKIIDIFFQDGEIEVLTQNNSGESPLLEAEF